MDRRFRRGASACAAKDARAPAEHERRHPLGRLDAAAYEEVARKIVERFPSVADVAITLRESLSADPNNWGALLYDAPAGRTVLSPRDNTGNYAPYEIRDIVEELSKRAGRPK